MSPSHDGPLTASLHFEKSNKVGVLTSGGDAQGMNAALRGVVRATIHWGGKPFAIREGWQGAVEGGDLIQEMDWASVSNIQQRGGTAIGTARSEAFRTHEGIRSAVKNLVSHGIDRLVVIGGDGSLTGANELTTSWSELLAELVELGEITQDVADRHPELLVVGLVGTIDNDLVGTDTTIGSDTALHRIGDAVDSIRSTAASHQRSFVVEVMGRLCGYLPLIASIAGNCDATFIPEHPPADGWEKDLADKLLTGRQAGRRESIVLVAEGARDRNGKPITSQDVAAAMEQHMGEQPRITILGHVQRGGNPSAYDRWMSTALGVAAAGELVFGRAKEPIVLGTSHGRVITMNLMEAVKDTRAAAKAVKECRFDEAFAGRGSTFVSAWPMHQVMSAPTEPVATGLTRGRIAVMHSSALSPGMNAAVGAAVRVGHHLGFDMVGVQGGVEGFSRGDLRQLTWRQTSDWFGSGGCELGTTRDRPGPSSTAKIAEVIAANGITGILLIGGMRGYRSLIELGEASADHPALCIPTMAVPASIDNNLPGTYASIGADTALNNIVSSLDNIKQAASAHKRCFIVETMGRRCGYLAALGAIASGAERAYLPEEGVSLADLHRDVMHMRDAFTHGRKLFLAIMGENISEFYNREVMASIFEEEGSELFDVRDLALGHVQQGGQPTPFDRLLATQLAWFAMHDLADQVAEGTTEGRYCGVSAEGFEAYSLEDVDREMDADNNRPREQWWLNMREIIKVLATPAPLVHDQWGSFSR